jgi:hypothetical protein
MKKIFTFFPPCFALILTDYFLIFAASCKIPF